MPGLLFAPFPIMPPPRLGIKVKPCECCATLTPLIVVAR